MRQFGIGMGVLLAVLAGCDQREGTKYVRLNGSSTVAPISMVAAEMYQKDHPNVRVTVGISGTGGGFKKFLDADPGLRTDINDASRVVKDTEIKRAAELGIEFVEIPIAMDGIAVIVHPDNDFCDHLTVTELKHIWEPGSAITNWSQVRQGFPDLELKLFGPGTDSGTFDYFTDAIVGEEGASREDFTMSEDDNVLVQGVAGTRGGLGYFGFAYYEANKASLKLLGIDNGTGNPVVPSIDVIRAGRYEPLSRPLFLYVNKASLARPEVKGFLEFYLSNAPAIVEHPNVNYVALSEKLYEIDQARLTHGITGSVMATAAEGDEKPDLEALYAVKP